MSKWREKWMFSGTSDIQASGKQATLGLFPVKVSITVFNSSNCRSTDLYLRMQHPVSVKGTILIFQVLFGSWRWPSEDAFKRFFQFWRTKFGYCWYVWRKSFRILMTNMFIRNKLFSNCPFGHPLHLRSCNALSNRDFKMMKSLLFKISKTFKNISLLIF